MIIKTHKELAKLIEGKKILHMNSLGKDSVLCLEWLTKFARPSHVVSVFFDFMAAHPDDDRYFKYLMKRYNPKVGFIRRPNTVELNLVASGIYQSPIFTNKIANHFEYEEFDRRAQIMELKRQYGCDFICDGSSKYESFARRTKFHQKGLEFKGVIYPLGMMTRQEVVGLIRDTGLKLHPSYKFAKGTYDHPSYWKMRSSYRTNDRFSSSINYVYPLFPLDMYRYERLLK